MNQMLRDAVMKLPVEERAALACEIWESLAPEEAPLTGDQIQELERRLAEHEADPSSAVPLEQLVTELQAMRR